MTTLALIATAMLALAALGLTLGTVLFLIKSRPAARTLDPGAPTPKAAILLAIRGPDPYLEDCIRALLHQEYPDYVLHIVVDSESDPAWNIVNSVIGEEGAENVKLALLSDPLFTCSLKCSALLQMLHDIDRDVEVVALIDGDVVPHKSWLRELVSPLSDPGVGASFGIPWYFPKNPDAASIARKLCWMPVSVLSALCGWMWGGTTALSAHIFRDPALAERWSRSVSSDASVRDIINAHKLRLAWSPSLLIPNLEPTTYERVFAQLSRTLSGTRLYLNVWAYIWFAVTFATGGLFLALMLCIIAPVMADMTPLIVSLSGLSGYLLILMMLAVAVDRRARKITELNGAEIPPRSVWTLIRMFITIPYAHGLYLASTLKAQFTRSLTWRGIRYAVNGKLDIARLEHEPVLNPPVSTSPALSGELTVTKLTPKPVTSVPSRLNHWRQALLRKKDFPVEPASSATPRRSELARESVVDKRG